MLPRRSRIVGAWRVVRMKLGHLLRGTPHPAPVGRPDYYTRELHRSLFVRSAEGLPTRGFLAPDLVEPQPLDRAEECFSRYGVYPLNFSFPTAHVASFPAGARPHFLSTTYPGEPHSFTQWSGYLDEYRSSYFGLSTKKGGWDTFRHLEIMFSGAIPLMPGLELSHRYSLAHYPKNALATILRSLIEEGPALPDEATQRYLSQWARENLTTQAMAQYLVNVTDMATDRVVFLDYSLPQRTDYLSAFTFIGLSEVLGKRLIAAWEPSYLFDDYSEDTSRLYGKGFGYSGVIPRSLRSGESLSRDAAESAVVALALGASTVVVGNYDANREQVGLLLGAGVAPEKIICVLGSDIPPDRSLLKEIRHSGMTFCVREFPF